MKVHLVLTPVLQGAAPGKAFATEDMHTVPQANDLFARGGVAYQVQGRVCVIDDVDGEEWTIMLARIPGRFNDPWKPEPEAKN